MKTCPNCKAEQMSSDVTACAHCGYTFDTKGAFTGDSPSDDEDLDFVVYEAHDQKSEFVGEEPGQLSVVREDDLGIETTAKLMEQEASHNAETGNFHSLSNKPHTLPIGVSAPPPPPPAYEEHDFKQSASTSSKSKPESAVKAVDTGAIRRLSDEELKRIERNLYGSKAYVSEKEKSVLINKLEDLDPVPFGNAPIVPPRRSSSETSSESPTSDEISPTTEPVPVSGVRLAAGLAASSDLPTPQMAKKGKGVAYFYKNFIELRGAGEICAEDEIVVNNREFVLKPKKIRRGYLMGAAVGAFVILLIVGASFFISDTTGYGELVGVVLDQNETPFIQGATVRFPDLGMSIKSNGQGFFKIDHVPAGTHKLEYIVGTNILKVDYATIASNEISTVFLRPESGQASQDQPRSVATVETPVPASTVVSQPEANKIIEPTPPPPATASASTVNTRNKTASTVKTAVKSEYGDVTLAANVDGAKLEIDGNVMGAGNLKFPRIKPGVHNYVVSLDGYHSVQGSFSLASGENKTLQVDLAPMQTVEKNATMEQDDFYYSGLNALRNGNYPTAISDLTRYIEKKPSSADAFFHRAEANNALLKPANAYDDYVHAAELYQVKGKFNEAVASYGRAIEIDDKTPTAYLGRAASYMNKGEELAAIGDYDKVIYLDRRNFQAYFGLGEARYRQGQYKQAIEQFKNAKSVDERNPLVYQYLTLAYLGVDDYKNVKKSYEKFQEYASKEQVSRFASDSKYATVMKIVRMQ